MSAAAAATHPRERTLAVIVLNWNGLDDTRALLPTLAANRMPADWQQRLPGIPWAQVVSLRNRLTHGYDEVDLDILWEIVVDDLPPLIDALEEALRDPAP